MGAQPEATDDTTGVESPPGLARGPDRRRRRGSALWGLVGAALVLVGAGALVASTAPGSDAGARVVGGNPPVNAGAGDPLDISAHNSPSLVRSPVAASELAVADRIDTPRYSCALHLSTDGGESWRQIPIPAPRGEEPKCYAPDVAFGADGTLHLSFVTLKGTGNVPNAVWLASMRRGQRTLSEPKKVLGALAFQVRLVADPDAPRRLYLSWLQGSDVALFRFVRPGNPIRLMRSDDGGASWSKPTRVSNPARARVVAPSAALGHGGEVYVLYLDLGEDRLDYEGAHNGRGGPPYPGPWKLVLARSRDRGATWEESVVEPRLVPSGRFIVFIPPFPSLAIDRKSNRVYASFSDSRFGDPDVRVWTLANGASSWQSTRVNDTPRGDRTSQYLPKLAVAPNGRLDVVYYDRRRDPHNVQNEVSLQSSYDHGASFTKRTTLSQRPFDSRIGFGSDRGLPDLGSRLGLLSTKDRAFAVWTDTRAGTQASGKQDLARALIAITSPDKLSDPVKYPLGYGGALLSLAGLALLGSWAIAATAAKRVSS